MSYDENMAQRVGEVLAGVRGIQSKKMFGGLCFTLNGNMLCGIAKGKFVARIGLDAYDSALRQKHVHPMDFTGRPLKGMVYVLPSGLKTQASLKKWVTASIAFVETLPKRK